MEFRILGPLEVASDGAMLKLGGRKQRLVLAHLIVRANVLVPAELLIDEVWEKTRSVSGPGGFRSVVAP